MTIHVTIHRLIPPGEKHGAKTACGIKLAGVWDDIPPLFCGESFDGGHIYLTEKGKPFDCKRCRVVLERHHEKRLTP